MTVVCHSVLLLLLIVLTTVTLAAQPVKGDASEGELTTPGGCISDWRGLKKAYLQRQSSADVENSIFDFNPSDAINYGVLVMFYDVGSTPNTSTSGRRECCQQGSKDCIIDFIYWFKIFIDIHPHLLCSRTGHHFRSWSAYQTNQLCWAPPPLCNNRSTETMLYEFSQQFVGLVMEESPFQVEMPAYVYGVSGTYRAGSLCALAVIPILLFATVGLFLVLYMHHSWGLVGTVLARSQVARHTMRSTMLTAWILLLLMMVHFYTATKAMADTVHKERLFTLFQHVYSPQVTAGYVQWGSFLAILLLEAPLLCIFFLCKATDLHNRRQQFSKTDCCLCYRLTVVCDTFGGIGVVGAIQIASVYLFYSTLYLTVSPIFVLTSASNSVAYIVVFLAYTTMLMQMVSSCCKTYSFGRIIKGLAFLLLGLLCTIVISYLARQNRYQEYNNNAFHGVLISLVPSVIIGIYGYTVKRLLLQKKEMEGAERGKQELEPLVKKEGGFP